jgi:1,4-alpha-glucan branching enzyme
MGWMHDTLAYFAQDPVYRSFHQHAITFSAWYAFSENFLLPLSHDEVVHGKGSLVGRMPGDDWQKFANLRCLFGYMWGHPGKKLVFMGGEFGQWREWNHDASLDWHLCEYPLHAGMRQWLRDLNLHYTCTPALYEQDFDRAGFEWIDCSDATNSVVAFLRRAKRPAPPSLVVCNFTPVPRAAYRVGVPCAGRWREMLNSDATIYGGSGIGNFGGADSDAIVAHGHVQSLALTLPPLGVLFLQHEG